MNCLEFKQVLTTSNQHGGQEVEFSMMMTGCKGLKHIQTRL